MLPVPVCAAQKGASTRKQAPKSRNRNGFEPMLCIRPPSRGSAYSWCYSTTVGYLCQGESSESGARSLAVVLATGALLAGGADMVLRAVQPAGLKFVHRNSATSQKYLIETMGSGVALLDYNKDGLLDIFFVN